MRNLALSFTNLLSPRTEWAVLEFPTQYHQEKSSLQAVFFFSFWGKSIYLENINLKNIIWDLTSTYTYATYTLIKYTISSSPESSFIYPFSDQFPLVFHTHTHTAQIFFTGIHFFCSTLYKGNHTVCILLSFLLTITSLRFIHVTGYISSLLSS